MLSPASRTMLMEQRKPRTPLSTPDELDSSLLTATTPSTTTSASGGGSSIAKYSTSVFSPSSAMYTSTPATVFNVMKQTTQLPRIAAAYLSTPPHGLLGSKPSSHTIAAAASAFSPTETTTATLSATALSSLSLLRRNNPDSTDLVLNDDVHRQERHLDLKLKDFVVRERAVERMYLKTQEALRRQKAASELGLLPSDSADLHHHQRQIPGGTPERAAATSDLLVSEEDLPTSTAKTATTTTPTTDKRRAQKIPERCLDNQLIEIVNLERNTSDRLVAWVNQKEVALQERERAMEEKVRASAQQVTRLTQELDLAIVVGKLQVEEVSARARISEQRTLEFVKFYDEKWQAHQQELLRQVADDKAQVSVREQWVSEQLTQVASQKAELTVLAMQVRESERAAVVLEQDHRARWEGKKRALEDWEEKLKQSQRAADTLQQQLLSEQLQTQMATLEVHERFSRSELVEQALSQERGLWAFQFLATQNLYLSLGQKWRDLSEVEQYWDSAYRELNEQTLTFQARLSKLQEQQFQQSELKEWLSQKVLQTFSADEALQAAQKQHSELSRKTQEMASQVGSQAIVQQCQSVEIAEALTRAGIRDSESKLWSEIQTANFAVWWPLLPEVARREALVLHREEQVRQTEGTLTLSEALFQDRKKELESFEETTELKKRWRQSRNADLIRREEELQQRYRELDSRTQQISTEWHALQSRASELATREQEVYAATQDMVQTQNAMKEREVKLTEAETRVGNMDANFKLKLQSIEAKERKVRAREQAVMKAAKDIGLTVLL